MKTNTLKTSTIHYLEMLSPGELCPKEHAGDVLVGECKIRQYPYNAFLYRLVGGNWAWTDKLSWTDGQWKAYVEHDPVQTGNR